MAFEGIQIPATLMSVAALWAGISYVTAPEIGKRLVASSNEVARCEQTVHTAQNRAMEIAKSKVGYAPMQPERPSENLGSSAFGMIMNNYPGGADYMRRYSGKLNAMTQPFIDVAFKQKMAQYEAAKQAWMAKLENVEKSFKLDPGSAKSSCECRARVAINQGHSGLAWYVGSVSLVKGAPVSDWQAAMRAPSVTALCPVES